MPSTRTRRIPMSWDEHVDCDLGDRRAEYIDGADLGAGPARGSGRYPTSAITSAVTYPE